MDFGKRKVIVKKSLSRPYSAADEDFEEVTFLSFYFPNFTWIRLNWFPFSMEIDQLNILSKKLKEKSNKQYNLMKSLPPEKEGPNTLNFISVNSYKNVKNPKKNMILSKYEGNLKKQYKLNFIEIIWMKTLISQIYI